MYYLNKSHDSLNRCKGLNFGQAKAENKPNINKKPKTYIKAVWLT